jgi:hypothetical protein
MQEFRVEREYSYWVLLGDILPKRAVRVGQRWLSSAGNVVEVIAIDDDWVTYVGDKQPLHTKDNFSFQCKYSLIL